MIYTVTFNPALDVSGEVDRLVPNEKSYVHNEIHTPGGNGINSGIIAHRLNSKVVLTGFIGGANGEEVKKLLDNNKVPNKFVPISGPTRMNLTISNKDDHLQTRLSFPGPQIRGPEKKKLEQFLAKNLESNDVLILGGSLPPGVDAHFVLKLMKMAHKKNAQCMVDMPGDLLKEAIKGGPDFIKPNLTEFQALVGKKVKTIKSVLTAAQKLLSEVPMICISSVEGGALLITKDEVWYGKIPKVTVRSTVGAGDSMVGAMASAWNKSSSVEELLRLGLAASSATLTERGLTLGSKKSILYYKPLVFTRPINK